MQSADIRSENDYAKIMYYATFNIRNHRLYTPLSSLDLRQRKLQCECFTYITYLCIFIKIITVLTMCFY